MSTAIRGLLILTLMAFPLAQALADDYSDTIGVFRKAGQSAKYFGSSYGYAVFPTIGMQFGGQAYSQIIFFQDKRAFDTFTGGNFEFGAAAAAATGGMTVLAQGLWDRLRGEQDLCKPTLDAAAK